MILINKIDLVESETLSQLEHMLRALNPGARLLKVSRALSLSAQLVPPPDSQDCTLNILYGPCVLLQRCYTRNFEQHTFVTCTVELLRAKQDDL